MLKLGKFTFKKESTIIISCILVTIVGFVVLLPAPFKPSLWSYLYRKNIDKQLSKSTESIYLPDPTKYHRLSFEIYKNWKNAYVVRAQSTDGTVGAYYYQLSNASTISADSEGLEQDDIDTLNMLRTKTDCTMIEDRLEICALPATNYKVHGMRRSKTAREFAKYTPESSNGTVLITDLTTNGFIDGYKIDSEGEHLTYIPVTDSIRKSTLDTLKAAKPTPLLVAKDFFRPEF
jgi:hypothetical protein